MTAFIDIVFSSVNISLSILLIVVLVYWLFTIFVGIDFDLDFDVDIDADIDIDIDTDAGIEGGNLDFEDVFNSEIEKEMLVGKRQKPLKWWQIFLIYFNFVGLPFMFTFTAFVISWWSLSILATSLTFSYENALGYLWILAAMIPALFVSKIITTPFKSFFKKLNKDGDKAIDFVGRQGTCLSNIANNKLGRAEIVVDGSPMNIYIKSLKGESIAYQDTILIIQASEDKNYYYVQKYDD